ncbi:hypothetical protein OIU84_015262 [Salix udensis]|uniref:Uncharacterized protein n=1 Tax=Salix udensis TaxID=889485 RepID=A0AAD6JE20_9ROSI|nr:hypothetical protein OIU84_015262 [Salix udensis]
MPGTGSRVIIRWVVDFENPINTASTLNGHQWIHRHRHQPQLRCSAQNATVEDAWIHVYGFCAAVAYFHAAALHCLSLFRLLSKAAFP